MLQNPKEVNIWICRKTLSLLFQNRKLRQQHERLSMDIVLTRPFDQFPCAYIYVHIMYIWWKRKRGAKIWKPDSQAPQTQGSKDAWTLQRNQNHLCSSARTTQRDVRSCSKNLQMKVSKKSPRLPLNPERVPRMSSRATTSPSCCWSLTRAQTKLFLDYWRRAAARHFSLFRKPTCVSRRLDWCAQSCKPWSDAKVRTKTCPMNVQAK